MGKTKPIGDLVMQLQEENARLKGLMSLFNRACRAEFGYDVRELHALLAKQPQMGVQIGTLQGKQWEEALRATVPLR